MTSEMWTNFVGHVDKEEEKFLDIEYITDEVFDELPEVEGRHIMTITGDTSSSESDFDSD